jgi:hypothetical protein
MNFAPQMDTLMKPFLGVFGQCERPAPLTKADQKIYQSILISLYKDIYLANATIFQAGCFKSELIKEKSQFKQPEGKDSRYFPTHIQQYIRANEHAQLIYTCGNVGEREIKVIFTLFAEPKDIEPYTQYVRMMYIWLHICGQYAEKACTENLKVFLYPTPFTKKLPASPSTTIGPEHINTAFTMACAKNGQIIIFREEEWFKVFIHETFHSYGLDFATQAHDGLKNVLRGIFPINSDFDIYEAYTETWARIINCAFCSFNALPVKKDQAGFLSNLKFCLEMERMFALYQCIKVLGFMGLRYDNVYHSNTLPNTVYLRNLYKENTHVFAYYIMTAIFLNDQTGFMLWCKKNNTRLLKFQATPAVFTALADYIGENYKCISLLKGLSQMSTLNAKVNKSTNKELSTTTRMSLIHTI